MKMIFLSLLNVYAFVGENTQAIQQNSKGKFVLIVEDTSILVLQKKEGKKRFVLAGGFLKKRENTITLEDIIDILSGKKSSNPNVLKIITEEITIRKGKYGPYIFYKTANMKKPRFLKLKNFEWKTLPSAAILTWIKTEYNI